MPFGPRHGSPGFTFPSAICSHPQFYGRAIYNRNPYSCRAKNVPRKPRAKRDTCRSEFLQDVDVKGRVANEVQKGIVGNVGGPQKEADEYFAPAENDGEQLGPKEYKEITGGFSNGQTSDGLGSIEGKVNSGSSDLSKSEPSTAAGDPIGKAEDGEDRCSTNSAQNVSAVLHKEEEAPQGSVLDLGAIDASSRKILSTSGYAAVFDVSHASKDTGKEVEEGQSIGLTRNTDFEKLVQCAKLRQSLVDEFNIKNPTHVQAEAIPLLRDGKDLVMQSHTGSGKTLAYILPIIENLDLESGTLQAVVLVPTRELGMQIYREVQRLSTDVRSTPLIGGANPHRQMEKLKKVAPHVVVGTPGRVKEMSSITKKYLKLQRIKVLVVDEVDYFLNPVFLADVESVIEKCNPKRQLIFVSATSDGEGVKKFARRWMTGPVLLRVGGTEKLPVSISHWVTTVFARQKFEVVRKLMYAKPQPRSAICFVSDPRGVEVVTQTLISKSVAAGALKGDSQKLDRAEVLRFFRQGTIQLLVTTEIAARGLDFDMVSHIINFDLPTDSDHYLHRAGRCGRMGREGHVINIVEPGKEFVVRKFARELKLEITEMELRQGEYREPPARVPTTDSAKRARLRSRDKVAERSSGIRELEGRIGRDGRKRGGSKAASSSQTGSRSQTKQSGAENWKSDNTHDGGAATPVKRSRRRRDRSRDLKMKAKAERWVGNRE